MGQSRYRTIFLPWIAFLAGWGMDYLANIKTAGSGGLSLLKASFCCSLRSGILAGIC